MKKLICMLAVVFSVAAGFVFSSCHREGNIDVAATDPAIMYMGRVVKTDSMTAVFSYPGVTAMFDFEGTGAAMRAKPGSGYFMVEIDTLAPRKINFADSISEIVLADSLPLGSHHARIVYAIEGHE